MTPLLIVIGVVLGVPTLLVSLVWLFQERIAFQPPPAPGYRLSPSASLSQVDYIADDNQPLLAYIVGRPESATGLLLYFHGNADLAINGISWAETVLQRTSFTVMLAEYRGYMNLGGRSTYASCQLDSEAAYDYVRRSLHLPSGHGWRRCRPGSHECISTRRQPLP